MATPEDRNYLRDNLLDDDEQLPVSPGAWSEDDESLSPPPRAMGDESSWPSPPPRTIDGPPGYPVWNEGEQPPPPPPRTTAEFPPVNGISAGGNTVPPPYTAPRQSVLQQQDSVRSRNPFRQQSTSSQQHPTQRNTAFSRQESGRRPNERNVRCVISIDYGTTYTGFAHAITYSDEPVLDEITVLQKWTLKMSNHQKVRSLISYTKPFKGEAQWASDISKKAITMVNTKLELEPRDTLLDELELTFHVLKGTKNLAFDKLPKDGAEPEFPCKSPREIVTDYLTKVYECAKSTLGMEQLVQTKTPVDIVVTVPVNWSYQAVDSTFKAVRAAGFNQENFPTLKDMILVSEPEAASYFTARDPYVGGTDFLEGEDCFILCDAGGGTIDVVALQVKKVKPYLQLELATKPTSNKCGSTFIDLAFKSWLRDLLGPERYGKLDPANARGKFSAHTIESGPMRKLISDFEKSKKLFSNTSGEITLDLPAPLNRLSIEGRVSQGGLIISHDEMKQLVKPCVNGLIELIIEQINEVVRVKGRRVKNAFLVGGFGASPYLQEELKRSLKKRNVEMRRPDPDKSWTAVVQGGVIYGIEKYRHKDLNCMSASGRSYGIVVNGQFQWLIRKGDVVLSREKRKANSNSFWLSRDEATMDYGFPIYTYRHNADDDVPSLWQHGQYEVTRAGVVKCDFGRIHDQDLRAGHMHGNAKYWSQNIGPLKCYFTLSVTMLEAELFCGKICVGRSEIKVPAQQTRRHSADSGGESDY